MATATSPIVDSRLGAAASAFVTSEHKMYIDGKFTSASAGKTFAVYNPATGEEICQVPEGDHVDVDRAVRAARRAFDGGAWRDISPSKRGQLLYRLGGLLGEDTGGVVGVGGVGN